MAIHRKHNVHTNASSLTAAPQAFPLQSNAQAIFPMRIPPTIFSTVGPTSGIAAVGIFAITDLVLSIATPDYNAIGETTSQLMNADARYGVVARLSLGLYCVFITPFIIWVSRTLRGNTNLKRIRTSTLWLHLVFSISAAVFQNESPKILFSNISINELHDRSGELLYAFALIAVFTTIITELTNSDPRLKITSAVAATVMSLAGLGLYFQWFPELTGLQERIGLIGLITWIVVVALSARQPRSTAAMR